MYYHDNNTMTEVVATVLHFLKNELIFFEKLPIL